MAHTHSPERIQATLPDDSGWAPLTPVLGRKWNAARDELAALWGWTPGPRAKRRWKTRAEDVKAWFSAAPRAPGEDVWNGMVIGPDRLADESPEAAKAAARLWEELGLLATEERLALEAEPAPAQGDSPPADALANRPDNEGLARVAPGAQRRLPRAMAAIERAAEEGLADAHILRMCAASVCQCAEWAFWSTGRRVQAGAEALEPMRNLFYDADAKGTQAALVACWDARALGMCRRGKLWRESEKSSVVAVFLAIRPSPWESGSRRDAASQAERARDLDAIWGSRWMKMALEASQAGERPFEHFAASLWGMAVCRNYCSEIDYWRYAVAHGVDPALTDDAGQNALHWICEPIAETGSEGYFTLASPQGVAALFELGPHVDWLAPDAAGRGPFDAGEKGLEHAERKASHAQSKALALALSEQRELGAAVSQPEAEGALQATQEETAEESAQPASPKAGADASQGKKNRAKKSAAAKQATRHAKRL